MNVLEIRDLKKRYGSVPVLKGLSASVVAGEVYGFLGRNGAGKSTTIRIAMGITQASSGEIRLFGEPMTSRSQVRLRQRIGYVSQEQHFYPWMTPRSLGRFVAGFYPRWQDAQYVELLERLDVPHDRRIGQLSGGTRVKLALCLALAPQPELLLLDEPTAGLDPVARREFLEIARDQASARKLTTFFSTHLIDEVELAADRVAIVEDGATRFEGTVAELSKTFYLLVMAPGVRDAALPPGLASGAVQILSDRTLRGQRRLMIQAEDRRRVLELIDDYWEIEKPSLEDVFVHIVRKPS